MRKKIIGVFCRRSPTDEWKRLRVEDTDPTSIHGYRTMLPDMEIKRFLYDGDSCWPPAKIKWDFSKEQPVP